MRKVFIIACGIASAASGLICGIVLLARHFRLNSTGLEAGIAVIMMAGVLLAAVVAGVIGAGIAALLSRPDSRLAQSTRALWAVGLVVCVGMIPAVVGILYAGSRILHAIEMRPYYARAVVASKEFERAGLPLYPNATATGASANEVSLSTRDPASNVVAFYESHLDRSWVRDSRWELPRYIRPGITSDLQMIEILNSGGTTSVELYQCYTALHLGNMTHAFRDLLRDHHDDRAFRLLSPRFARSLTNGQGLRAGFDAHGITDFSPNWSSSSGRAYFGADTAYVDIETGIPDPRMSGAVEGYMLRVHYVKLGGLWWIDSLRLPLR